MKRPNFRSIEHIEVTKIIIAEGEGIEDDPIREVHYYFDELDNLLYKYDPCEKEQGK